MKGVTDAAARPPRFPSTGGPTPASRVHRFRIIAAVICSAICGTTPPVHAQQIRGELFDGSTNQPIPAAIVSLLDSAMVIEAIEIYMGVSTIPLRYAGTGVCGVVLIWTRH